VKYLLDSNVCVDYLTGRYPPVTSRIHSYLPEDLCLSSIVVAELRYGADKSARPRRNHRLLDVMINEIPCRDFDSRAASIYGKVRAALEKKGELIGPNDMFDDPGFDNVRQEANNIADYLRKHGPFEPHRLPLEEMEYTTMPAVMAKLRDRWAPMTKEEAAATTHV